MRNFLIAARPIVIDSLGVIFFALLLALGVTPRAAAAIGLGITIGHIGFLKLKRRPVAALQWTVLVLVLGSAAATMATDDPRFMMVKPTIVYLAISAALLKRGWMLRYVPAWVAAEVGDVTTIFGFAWSALMLATALLNLVVAVYFAASWPVFIAVVPFASKVALFLLQFFVTRSIYRARLRAREPRGPASEPGGETGAARGTGSSPAVQAIR